jgi:hypothetical protein
MRRISGGFVAALLLPLMTTPAAATTAHDLTVRMVIDGHATEWEPDESLFGISEGGSVEEATDDSRAGPSDDIHQIRLTWDRRRLYLAGEGIIRDHNMVLVLDPIPTEGLADMTMLNSWRRNVLFDGGFGPDLFVGTWDGSPSARLCLHVTGNIVNDLIDTGPGGPFDAASTFLGGATGRAVEVSIPWSSVFLRPTGRTFVRDSVVDAGGRLDTLAVLPPGAALSLAGFVTFAWDGSGGMDTAPDNVVGVSWSASDPLHIDNWITLVIDQDGDGLADVGASPRGRVVFHDTSTPAQRSSWGSLKARYR